MPRLTVTLDDDLHRALKETAARQGRSINAIIEESLRFRGIRDRASARTPVERARRQSGMTEHKAMNLAIEEVRKVRRS
ncbi:ribbon-helix-helix protein, CopG family [Geoalkalibacter halelectricus]|uniref:Ribbon-helix-helix protein, CopG family n=1 Tax=Geoalkalibacter halelectricus TaxID=2847045 RepID=A0ABY5ZNH1_9BACT|nr:ribbon-helix-helix protein, CopG family [Geoalkalibacter halelectricus]MDO3378985.1 ribbon-helix-helix protein, CopG family [Geoalkalibacter halelectricus]UWZ78801.1 ribbon-helix-helix protein, CopG family [Geoalkalibacter halelectricus]